MKKLLLGSVATVALMMSGKTYGADLPVKAPPLSHRSGAGQVGMWA